jgi:hypothetical protein
MQIFLVVSIVSIPFSIHQSASIANTKLKTEMMPKRLNVEKYDPRVIKP